MHPMRCFTAILICVLGTSPLLGQRDRREPLTAAQIEQIREAGIDPPGRVKLYTKFLDDHADTIKGVAKRLSSAARNRLLDDEIQDFTALMDELAYNLDVYSGRKADIRKSLKPLTEAAQRWLAMLHALPGEPGYDLARKEAIEDGEDLANLSTRLLQEQTEYFNVHKDEQGQDRAEPK
jgi:hypothetical protein